MFLGLICKKCGFSEESINHKIGEYKDAHAFEPPDPISLLLWCPECSTRHIDEGEFAKKRHHTHACQSCGHVWRPALQDSFGVQFLPGFKN